MIIYSSSPHNGFNLKTAGRTTDVCEAWRNWQTRTFEVRVVYPWGFKSPPSH